MKSYIIAIVTSLAIAGFSCLLQTYIPSHIKTAMLMDVLEVFFSVFGVIYAIVTGFVVLVVLNHYSDIKKYISAEINALQDLRDYLLYVDNNDGVVADIKSKIKTYAQSVTGKEWPNMLSGKKTDVDTSEELYELMKSIKQIKVTNQSDVVALEKLIDTVGEITTYRTNRLSASSEKLPPLLKHLVLVLSVFLIFIFSLTPIESTIVCLTLNAVNAFAVVFIYQVVLDLNNPFKGSWCITCEPFEVFLQKI